MRALTTFESIAAEITAARERSGYSQADLAEKSGVSVSTIQRIEQKHIISPPTLAKVEAALQIGIKISWEPKI